MAGEIKAYIGLGSNLGDRAGYFRRALEMLRTSPGVSKIRTSEFKETTPLGGVDQPAYLNAVAEVITTLSASELLEICRNIENELGRVRTGTNSSRTIDLDIELYGDEVVRTDELKVPHPDLHLRSFVLDGIIELDPAVCHPILKRSLKELASRLNGQSFMPDRSQPQLVSMAGVIGVGKTTLADGLAKVLGGSVIHEAYDTNPYLPRLYAGQKEFALDCQLYFLVTRVKQLSNLKGGELAFSDYVFEKEHIYAKRCLNDEQFALYYDVHSMLCRQVAQPVLLINLKASVDQCLERIHNRNRPYEQGIRPSFLEAFRSDYEEMVANWTKSPVITVGPEMDFRDPEVVNKFAEEVKLYLYEAK